MIKIKDYIPQREPFLFLEEVVSYTDSKVIVKTSFSDSRDFFKGHFPGDPVVPGVILSEAAFQSGALLASLNANGITKTAVVSRIQGAKFKSIVRPNEELIIETSLIETLGSASFFKTKIKREEKSVLEIEFSCALIERTHAG